MPLYHNNGANMPQLAQQAMGSATSAMAAQQKQTTTTTKRDTDFWDDLYKGARALNAGANAVSTLTNTADNVWGMYDKYKLRDAYDEINKAYSEGGLPAIQNSQNMQDYHHMQALGQFLKDRANTQKGYNEMLKGMEEQADKLYQNWRLQAKSVREAWESGDMQRYMPLMQQLVASSPLPYRLELDGKGNFKEMFRSDEAGGWTATGRIITPQEAYDEMNKVWRGEQTMLRGAEMKPQPFNEAFNMAALRAYWGTNTGNHENMVDPKKQTPLYDKNGNFGGVAITLNPMGEGDYDKDSQVYVYGKDNQLIGVFNGINGAMSAGLSPFYRPEGKGRRGGGTGAGGVAGTGGSGSGRYSLSKDDMKDIKDFATQFSPNTNPETGEKNLDYELAGAIEDFIQRTGTLPHKALSLYGQNISGALKHGATPEQAKKFAIDKVEEMLNQRSAAQKGVQQPQQATAQKAGQQAQGGASAQKQQAHPDMKPAYKRMRQAAAGVNGASGTNSAIPPELAGSDPRAAQISPYKMQDGAYRMMKGIGEWWNTGWKYPEKKDEPKVEDDPWEYRP